MDVITKITAKPEWQPCCLGPQTFNQSIPKGETDVYLKNIVCLE